MNTINTLSLTPVCGKSVREQKLGKLASLKREIEQLYKKKFQYSILLSTVKEVVCNSESSQIHQKVQRILAAEEVPRFTNLICTNNEYKQESLMVLGLEDYQKRGSYVSLSYSEKANLKCEVEDKLLDKCHKIQKYDQHRGERLTCKVRIPRHIISSDIFEFVRKAHSQFLECFENVMTLRNLLKESYDSRVAHLETVRLVTVPWYETRCENLELESRILELQILFHMFKEDPRVCDATKKVIGYAQSMYERTKFQLEKVRNDEKAYNRLEGTEFDKILMSYKKCKLELDNKLWLLKELS